MPSLSRRPILLIGDIGVGKTMFIKHLYQVREPEVFANALVFYIDFGYKPTLEKDLRTFIESEIVDQRSYEFQDQAFLNQTVYRKGRQVYASR